MRHDAVYFFYGETTTFWEVWVNPTVNLQRSVSFQLQRRPPFDVGSLWFHWCYENISWRGTFISAVVSNAVTYMNHIICNDKQLAGSHNVRIVCCCVPSGSLWQGVISRGGVSFSSWGWGSVWFLFWLQEPASFKSIFIVTFSKKYLAGTLAESGNVYVLWLRMGFWWLDTVAKSKRHFVSWKNHLIIVTSLTVRRLELCVTPRNDVFTFRVWIFMMSCWSETRLYLWKNKLVN